MTLALGNYRDALFGGVIVANTLIGIVQEVRAKRVLDRLALLVAPRARVWRDGELADAAGGRAVVPGDVVRLEPGDQVVADGPVVDVPGALAGRVDPHRGERARCQRAEGEPLLSGGLLRRRRPATTGWRRSGRTASPSASPPRPRGVRTPP